MNEFYNALMYVNKMFYEPNRMSLKAVREEVQNSEYGAGVFQLNSKSIRFRVAKITPTKIGQFVAFMVINTFTHASKQSIETQKWQLEYFVGMSNTNSLPVQELLELYSNENSS
ncbi:MepB family protein [Bacillus pumilus]|uniref:MepB family protein n=1 Tax=Bacillus pumilus TaxID=1408 RepID=UPI003F43AAD8